MFDPVCAVRSSRALRPGEGLDGGKEAMVARQRMKARKPKSQSPNPKSEVDFRGSALGVGIWDFGFLVLAALLVLAAEGRAHELPAVSTVADSVAPPASTPPPPHYKGHAALSSAIELQRRGEFEQAAVRLREAVAQKDSLTTTEQEELARLLQANRS